MPCHRFTTFVVPARRYTPDPSHCDAIRGRRPGANVFSSTGFRPRGRLRDRESHRRRISNHCLGAGGSCVLHRCVPGRPRRRRPGGRARSHDAGAPQFALTRIEALQPADPRAPRWADWEALRCEVLARLSRNDALLARGASLLPERTLFPTVCLLESRARGSRCRTSRPLARVHAAQLLWQSKASAAEVRSARLAVIESYVAERRGEDAFRSMLRFQQDYQPLDRADCATVSPKRCSTSVSTAKRSTGSAHPTSRRPTRLRLQLRSAGARARSGDRAGARRLCQNAADPGVLARDTRSCGCDRGTGRCRSRRSSACCSTPASREEAATAAEARAAPRQAYLATANDIGNREQLADGRRRRVGGLRRAPGRAPTRLCPRAFYAYLAQRAQNPDMRRNAQLCSHFRCPRQSSITRRCASCRSSASTRSARRADALPARHDRGESQRPGARAQVVEWIADAAQREARGMAARARANRAAGRRFAGERRSRASSAGRARPAHARAFRGALELAQEMLDARQLAEARAVYEALVPAPATAARGKRCWASAGCMSSTRSLRRPPMRICAAARAADATSCAGSPLGGNESHARRDEGRRARAVRMGAQELEGSGARRCGSACAPAAVARLIEATIRPSPYRVVRE